MRSLALAQIARGHRVTVVTPACGAHPPGVVESEGLRVVWVAFPGYRQAPFHGQGLPEALSGARALVPVQIAAAMPLLWRALWEEARRAGPDAHLIGHWLVPGGGMAQSVARVLGLEATTVCHSGAARMVSALPAAVARPLIRAALGPGDFVASCEDVVKVMECASGLSLSGRARVGPMPVELLVRRAEPVPGPPWRLATLGRHVPIKGLDLLLRAVAQSSREIILCMYGDGPESEQLQDLAKSLGVDARFEGVVVGRAKEEALSRCHALVMPSRRMPDGRTEGAPLAIVEALSLGMPVVATEVGGCGALLEGRPKTYLASPDVEGLGRALEALCKDLVQQG